MHLNVSAAGQMTDSTWPLGASPVILALGSYTSFTFLKKVLTRVFRGNDGKEVRKIVRSAPVWTCCWNPSRDEPFDVLAVGVSVCVFCR